MTDEVKTEVEKGLDEFHTTVSKLETKETSAKNWAVSHMTYVIGGIALVVGLLIGHAIR